MVHYSDYLQLDKILDAQLPESEKQGKPAHDEMLFIVIHQAYELWFKELLHEVESVASILSKPVNDNSPELQTVVHRLSRITTILKVLVHQVDIMETMTPMDFLDFRDMLRPASGFQSWQFKLMEARLGLSFGNRHGQQYYTSQLREEHIKLIKDAEAAPTILQLVNEWLERMPFFNEEENWKNYVSISHPGSDDFWKDYRTIYEASLADAEKENIVHFDRIFFANDHGQPNSANGHGQPNPSNDQGQQNHGIAAARPGLSPAACRSALFIMLYRGYPILQLPFQLLNNLLEIDEQLSTWRYRHMNMVHRMIGTRIGTGGSSGKDYLAGAAQKHFIFTEIAALTSFLIERRKLPVLSKEMERRLGFLM